MTENDLEHNQKDGHDAAIPPHTKSSNQNSLVLNRAEKDFRNTKIVFALLFGSMFLTLLPFSVASFFALLLSICTLSGVYSMRSLAEEDSIIESHMNFLITTFWRVALFVLITGIFATLFLLIFANYHKMDVCINNLDNIAFSALGARDASQFNALFDVCSRTFMRNNNVQTTVTSIIAFGPVLVYLLYRCQKGWKYIASRHFIEKI